MTVTHGRPSGHVQALGEDEAEDVDIAGKAPTREHRAMLVEPTGDGPGVLAVEVINGACPASRITKCLSHWSKETAEEQLAESGGEPTSWKLTKLTPLGDERQLRKFVDEAESQSLTLLRHDVTGDRKRARQEIVVTAYATTAERSMGSLLLAQTWVDKALKSEDVDRAEALRSLASVVGPEIAEMDFDDGYVVVQGSDGHTKRIRPGNLNDVFTYQMSERVDDDSAFYTRVEATVRSIEVNAGLSIDWDD